MQILLFQKYFTFSTLITSRNTRSYKKTSLLLLRKCFVVRGFYNNPHVLYLKAVSAGLTCQLHCTRIFVNIPSDRNLTDESSTLKRYDRQSIKQNTRNYISNFFKTPALKTINSFHTLYETRPSAPQRYQRKQSRFYDCNLFEQIYVLLVMLSQSQL